ncbi:NAP-domain-containing protein [Gigaspora margarita]|uniref:NAP-domain-containing protein n=1 Tax=Gigaspora margarita TaxID=4874 RepID=A0A8H3XHB2_GIGMA|nr:NAP-domain-containing protein [Gigaspora margarita]
MTQETNHQQNNQLNRTQPSPQLVSLLQGKLNTLIGKSSGYIENLPEDVKRRICGLNFYQFEHAKLEAKFQEEILALEKKYLKLYQPYYEKRAKVVRGECEPAEEEITAGASLFEKEKERQAQEGDPATEKNKEVQGDPAAEKSKEESTGDSCKGIPEFWLTAMKNLITISDNITERDEEALKHLIDIRISYLENPGFQLEFEFEENKFFSNTLLVKTYYYQDEPGYGGDYVYDHAEGTKIDWKEGMDLTITVETKRQKHKGTNKTRVVKTTVPAESFFQFFNPPPPDCEEDDDDADLDSRLETDYQIGEDIKEKLIPRAIDWYTGKALEYEDMLDDDEYFEGDDYDEGDYEIDDDEDDGDDEGAGGRNGEVGERPECKQQ